MDEADIANDLADAERERALSQIKVTPPQAGIGICINCAAPVEDDRRWCCVACRDDWIRYANRKA